VTVKLTPKERKVKEVKCTRDLFGRLLYLAMSQKLDLGLVLSYPLTGVPLALFSITGGINKISKSALVEKVEAMGLTNKLPKLLHKGTLNVSKYSPTWEVNYLEMEMLKHISTLDWQKQQQSFDDLTMCGDPACLASD